MEKNANKKDGSVWNVNNWHWENKNFDQEGKELVKSKFQGLSFEKEGILFTVTKINKIEGHTEACVRKNKLLIIFEFEVEADFRAEKGSKESEGSFIIREINESDLDFLIPKVSIKKGSEFGNIARQLMKKNLRKEVEGKIGNLLGEIREMIENKKD